MKIVIDIDDREWMDEKSIREVAFEYEKGCAFDRAIREGLKQAIVLPEHHGRLIDADWVKNTLDIYVINEYNGQFIRRSDIDKIPTIIEGSDSK